MTQAETRDENVVNIARKVVRKTNVNFAILLLEITGSMASNNLNLLKLNMRSKVLVFLFGAT